MWLLILLLAGAVVGFMGISLWQGRHALLSVETQPCPHCGGSFVQLTELGSGLAASSEAGWDRSYQVLACGSCGFGITTVHGRRSLFAYCPKCQQLAMETAPEPNGVTGGVPRVTIAEHCHLCGHSEQLSLPSGGDVDRPDGQVLPFRGKGSPTDSG